MATVLASTTELTHEEWIQQRRSGIGSSDAAAVAGLNPWCSALEVYLRKVGEIGEPEDNERMEWGRRLESVIAEAFQERTGLRVRRRNAVLQHPDHPFMLANLDREVVGHPWLLEIKTTSAYNADAWADGAVPPQYEIQCLHQLAVTGRDGAYLAVLIGGQQLEIREVHRDEETIQNLIEIERQFWEEHVVPKVPPEPEGSASDAEALLHIYPESNGQEIELPPDATDVIREREQARQVEKAAAERKKAAEQKLQALLGEYERGWAGSYRVDWKPVVSRRIDTKALKADHPEIAEEYETETTTRRFGIKEG